MRGASQGKMFAPAPPADPVPCLVVHRTLLSMPAAASALTTLGVKWCVFVNVGGPRWRPLTRRRVLNHMVHLRALAQPVPKVAAIVGPTVYCVPLSSSTRRAGTDLGGP